ncbi:MAG TPA: TIGR00725 family protein, partial [Firmicutes bacterium]|nr:TIGR00725 family protein [Bacillota bacterium]
MGGSKIQVSLIGGSKPPLWAIEAAEEVGKLIARRGATLVCGGMRGVMEAACRGAREEGGLTVGIIPYYEKDKANKYLDVVIPTGLGLARNALVAASGDV